MSRRVAGRDAEAETLDRAVRFGDAVFETFRVQRGAVRAFGRHLARLRLGAARLGLDVPDDEALRREVGAACRGEGDDLFVRLSLVRAGGAGLRALPSAAIVCVDVAPRPTPPPGLRAASVPFGGPGPATGLKLPAYADVVAAFHARPEVDELIRLDAAGQVVEAAAANVFIVAEGAIRTPPAGLGALPGITRGLLLELGTIAGLPVREGLVCIRALATADEAFVTSSVRGVVPLVALDGRPLSTGPVAAEASRCLEAHTGRAVVVDEAPGTR